MRRSLRLGRAHVHVHVHIHVAMLAAFVALGCHPVPDPTFRQLLEARRVAAALHVEFVKATDASDRAVLADTDEASVAFARQADAAAQSVQTNAAELGVLLASLSYADETRQLDEFGKRFAAYRKVDHDVLELAVENTNLKAQRLSFGPVREAADAFRAALDRFTAAAPAKDRARDEAAATRAELDVREIQILQAPHIAEADDAAMNRLETEMATREKGAHDVLAALATGPGPKAALDDARAALDHFEKLSVELVALSRRNTNVKSLALSLKPKPALTAACDASLAALEAALAARGFSATR